MKILIVGAGSIGARHMKNLRALGYENLSVCDPFIRALPEELTGVAIYKDLETALKSEKPQVVFICNPTHLHLDSLRVALKYSAGVFVEKPLSHTFGHLSEIIKTAKAKKRTILVGCNYLFHSGFKKLKEAVDSPIYGKPIFARAVISYYLPAARKADYKKVYVAGKFGGVLLDSGSHAAYYLKALFGEIKKAKIFKSPSASLKIKGEEAACATFQHKGGVVSQVSLDYVGKAPMHRLEVVTNLGLLTLDMRGNSITFEDESSKRNIFQGDTDLNLMYVDELKHFLRCVDGKEKPAQTLEEGKRVLEVLLKKNGK